MNIDVRDMPTLLVALAYVACIAGGIYVSIRRHQPIWAGFLLGALLGPIGIIILAVLAPTSEGFEAEALDSKLRESSNTTKCPSCGRANSVSTRVCPRCETRLELSSER